MGLRKIVKFYADWCVPCKRVAPVIEKFCKDKEILLESVDVDKLSTEEKTRLKLKSIPTIHIHRDNTEAHLIYLGPFTEKDLDEATS